MFCDYGVLGWLQHAVEAPQHDHREHDETVLRRPIWAAQSVGDFPDFARDGFVSFSEHISPNRVRMCQLSEIKSRPPLKNFSQRLALVRHSLPLAVLSHWAHPTPNGTKSHHV